MMIPMSKPKAFYIILAAIGFSVMSCSDTKKTTSPPMAISERPQQKTTPKTKLSQAFKNYWYNGEAEITSYRLEQARYGELREGTAVLVFVTEDFLPEVQVKADHYSENNIRVLKLNATKNFNTGIYPYSIMESTFYPVADNQHALKITNSVQEWCGQTYMQLNNRDRFEIQSHSYFQHSADQTFAVDKALTENELWAKLRINPKKLLVGPISIVPSLEYLRLNHEDVKAYDALATLDEGSYTLSYNTLNRTLKINFNPNFPYDILGWEETTVYGKGADTKTLTTKATKLETLKTDYWNKKSKTDESLRETLKLP